MLQDAADPLGDVLTAEILESRLAAANTPATHDERRAALVEKVAEAWDRKALERELAEANAALIRIRAETLEEAASPAFLRPLIEEQSRGEWDDKTINEDVAMFAAAIRAMKGEA